MPDVLHTHTFKFGDTIPSMILDKGFGDMDLCYKNAGSREKIMVVSHERSGTHFLINSIAFNFPELIDSNIQIDVPPTTDKEKLLEFFERYKGHESRYIFKSHHQVDCFYGLEEYLKEYLIFYMVRDGRDVMTSCWYYFNQAPDAFPKTLSVGELMKINPWEYKFDKCYSAIYCPSMVERWRKHISGWVNNIEITNLKVVKYEYLLNNFDKLICCLGNIFKTPALPKTKKPDLNDHGVANRKGIVGDWKNHFTKDDEIFFNRIAGALMGSLGYYAEFG